MTKKREALDKAKQSWKKLLKWWKELWKWTYHVVKWISKTLWHTIKGGYHLIDAWDKAIWEKIEKKQIEKWKKVWKVSNFLRDNMIKLAMVLSLAGYWWYKTHNYYGEKNNKEKQEIVIEEKTGLSFEEKEYFKDPSFFEKDFEVIKDDTYKDKWIMLVRDAWMTFYIVQDGETKKEDIRKKLSSIPEFSYLKDSVYDDKIMGFNVPDASLKKWLRIPIPVRVEDRGVDINEFREYSKISIKEMINNAHYWEKTKKLIKEIGEEKVINTMIAFARCETSMDHKNFSDQIWTTELHRWEAWSEKTPLNAFSFSYYHILMEMNADGKTPWPWLKARLKLWLTEWQCYHPINAWKLFLWYCFEKVKSDPTYFFKINNLEEAKKKWGKYNWDSSYGQKLWDNIQYLSKK